MNKQDRNRPESIDDAKTVLKRMEEFRKTQAGIEKKFDVQFFL